MVNIFFWREWSTNERRFFLSLIGFLFALLVFYLIAYYQGHSWTISWDTVTTSEPIRLPFTTIDIGPISLPFAADFYLLKEFFQGSDIQVSPLKAYVLLGLLAVIVIISMTVATYLSRYAYLFAMILFIGSLVLLKIEQLAIFGRYDRVGMIVILLVYIIPSYAFNAFASKTHFVTRAATFGLITIFTAYLTYSFSGDPYPGFTLIQYGIVVPILFSVVFIFSIAHEIVAALFRGIMTFSFKEGKTKALRHFALIILVYWINLFITYLHNTTVIDWNIIYLDSFWLLPISIVLGIWGHYDRTRESESLSPFLSSILYLMGGMVTISTITYTFATDNTPLIEAFEDVIVYTHLSFGLLFFFYLMTNFYNPLRKGFAIERVIYKPTIMPLFVARLAGTIGFVAFFLKAGQYPLYQTIAGYYNGLGDLFKYKSELFEAEQYYKNGVVYDNNNFRSNYSLAALARNIGDAPNALIFFKASTNKKPHAESYANIANIYNSQERFFDALFSLNDGWEEVSDNPFLANNLGYQYAQTSILDSAKYYWSIPVIASKAGRSAWVNKLALSREKLIPINIDSIKPLLEGSDYVPHQVNLDLLSAKVEAGHFAWPEDSVVNPIVLSALNNRLFRTYDSSDTIVAYRFLKLSEASFNINYRSSLLALSAINYYACGYVKRAFVLMDRLLQTNPSEADLVNHYLGLWTLEQQAFDQSNTYLKRSVAAGNGEDSLALIFSEMSLGNWSEARRLLSTRNKQSPVIQAMSNVAQDSIKPDRLGDLEKYLFFKYRPQDSVELNIENEAIQTFADLISIQRLMDNGDLDSARLRLEVLQRQSLPDFLLERTIETSLDLYYLQKDWASMKIIVDQIQENNNLKAQYNYYQAILTKEEGVNSPTPYFHEVLQLNPFFEKGVIDASLHFASNDTSELKGYNLLLEALDINNQSIDLQKVYIELCLQIGLDNYAERGLQRLRLLTNKDDFTLFQTKYDSLVNLDKDNFF